jgi:uncharacterized protein
MLVRQIYIERIRPFMNKKLVKVLTGQRRVGKSVILQIIAEIIKAENPDTQIMFLDMENYAFDFLKTYIDLMEYIKINKKSEKIALFIDEIQNIDGFEKALRSLYSDQNFDIYITGSNANLLSGELGTLLSGRYIEIEVFPLIYTEYLELNKLADSETNFYTYLKFGGLPGLSELPENEAIKEEYLQNIYTSILFRDVIKRNQIRNIVFLENLVNFAANNIGSLLSSTKISKYLKSQNLNISTNIVIEYLDYLCNAFIIRKIKRYDVNGKKIFEIGEKYYFEDMGIRNALVGYRATEIQKHLENIVFNHLQAKQYRVTIGQIGDKEVDFVAEKNGERKYIQVTYLLSDQSTIDREFGNLLSIKDNYAKYVVSMDKLFSKNTIDGIFHLSIQDFLLNFE